MWLHCSTICGRPASSKGSRQIAQSSLASLPPFSAVPGVAKTSPLQGGRGWGVPNSMYLMEPQMGFQGSPPSPCTGVEMQGKPGLASGCLAGTLFGIYVEGSLSETNPSERETKNSFPKRLKGCAFLVEGIPLGLVSNRNQKENRHLGTKTL